MPPNDQMNTKQRNIFVWSYGLSFNRDSGRTVATSKQEYSLLTSAVRVRPMEGWVGVEYEARRIGVDITAGYDTPSQVQALVGGEGVYTCVAWSCGF